ncbi:MAG TPA: COX15/CtaA family protein [Verrucomicrobiae bacterium]
MTRTIDNPWLTRYAVLTAFATLGLICAGGLVTSHEAGLAVPDWPTTYGYNLFLFPVSKWVGGILYEHTHRLVASLVGLMTSILAVWLWLKEERRRLRWLGVAAFLAVGLQGVLGGLRVTQLKDEIGIFHATLAQLFFVLVCAIALFTSRWWRDSQKKAIYDRARLRYFFAFTTAMILLQLILGATMRHQHAGLAIPDFPTAYGQVWPDLDADSIARYNATRLEVTGLNAITAFQVALQMAHRIVAVLVLGAVALTAWRARRQLGLRSALTRISFVWLGLIVLQALLGVLTVLKNKPADIATAHVAAGALSLLTGSMLTLAAVRLLANPVSETASLPGALSQKAAKLHA